MSKAINWFHYKLDKIQYALDYMRRAQNGESVADLVNELERKEDGARFDLVSAIADDKKTEATDD